MKGKRMEEIQPSINYLRCLVPASGKATQLPEVKIVFPEKQHVVGHEIRLYDAQSGNKEPFQNSSDITIEFADGGSCHIGVSDLVTDEERARLLARKPIIARIVHLYEVHSVE